MTQWDLKSYDTMGPEIISKALYRHDPAKTGCNGCEDMEGEYHRVAGAIARLPDQPPSFDAFKAVLTATFFEEVLLEEAMRKSYREIFKVYGR